MLLVLAYLLLFWDSEMFKRSSAWTNSSPNSILIFQHWDTVRLHDKKPAGLDKDTSGFLGSNISFPFVDQKLKKSTRFDFV